MKLDTKIVRASTKPDEAPGAVVPPIFQTATYVLEEVVKDWERSIFNKKRYGVGILSVKFLLFVILNWLPLYLNKKI